MVNAQAKTAAGGEASQEVGPLGASTAAEEPQQEGTADGGEAAEVMIAGREFGWNEGQKVGGASGAAAVQRGHGGLQKAGMAAGGGMEDER